MLNIILILIIISVAASLANLFDKKRVIKPISMEVQLPGNLPIIALHNKEGYVMNFLLDSGSNISHICSDYYEYLGAELLGTQEEGTVSGLGATNVGITMCSAELFDVIGNKYKIDLSISEQLVNVSNSIESETGIRIHGLLGTDFLIRYNYIINFETLEVYPKK